ncbi:hypothetical protein [Rhodonellum sp.]|uniref:hypothetical protein n=1 Tax=Rhodonellum sp. TaxID=2231180 RepID=UPI00271EF225|nr:hypothetical protein [Rhodonellum sp.]MDO9550994.1 hypothetical protein [Rhodonellum sp.]
MLKNQDPVAYENKLKELTLFMGEVFKDPDARRELFDLAKIEGNDDDIEYSMKKLFSESTNPLTRQYSAIVSAFSKNAENHRVAGEDDFNEQDLIDFINDNNIGILAPYLYDNFEPESLTELTVSWWTEEKEIEELSKNPDWDGHTPGIKVKLNEDGNFIQFRKTETNYFSNDLVYANDDYAYTNPTVVFGSFNDDEMIVNPDDGWMGGGPSLPTSTIYRPHQIGVNCNNFDFNRESLRYRMPEFKMTGNTRIFPHTNKFSLWLAIGQYTIGTQTSINLNQLALEQKIARCKGSGCTWKTNFFPALVTNWAETSANIQIIMAYRKRQSDIVEHTVQVGVTSSTTGQTSNISQGLKINQERHRLIFSQTWGKCSEMLGQYGVDQQNGLRDGLAIHQFNLHRNDFKVQFTLVPEITRFE